MKTQLASMLLLATMAACAAEDGTTGAPRLPEGNASGGEDNTFDHPQTQIDVWELLARLQEEGPPKYTARVHSCPKIRYETIGRVLASRGVDIGNTTDLSAGQLYQ